MKPSNTKMQLDILPLIKGKGVVGIFFIHQVQLLFTELVSSSPLSSAHRSGNATACLKISPSVIFTLQNSPRDACKIILGDREIKSDFWASLDTTQINGNNCGL